ncbi:glycosyltransferase family 2 protein [Patescibacteria group bacterium]|nr:glycosyltransferase family 2 protein [Patescibacteria group bacterium]
MKKELKITILMPVYNGKKLVKDVLESIFKQNYKNYEVIISDDASKDDLDIFFEKNKFPNVKYFKNKTNLGYGNNMEVLRKLIPKDSEIVFLMAQDDILAKGALEKVNTIFLENTNVGALIRPFYMYGHSIHKPLRDFGPIDRENDVIVSVNDDESKLIPVINTVCQLSGLAFRSKFLKTPFHEHVMTSHIYPFMEILKDHPVMFIKDYIIAVRTYTSQTRHVPKIYEFSPQDEWGLMVRTVFAGKKYKKIRDIYLKYVYENFVSLVQLKNFSTWSVLFREYWVLLKNRPINFFNFKYWFFVIGTLVLPRQILLPMVDSYKEIVLSKLLKSKKLSFTGVKKYE